MSKEIIISQQVSSVLSKQEYGQLSLTALANDKRIWYFITFVFLPQINPRWLRKPTFKMVVKDKYCLYLPKELTQTLDSILPITLELKELINELMLLPHNQDDYILGKDFKSGPEIMPWKKFLTHNRKMMKIIVPDLISL